MIALELEEEAWVSALGGDVTAATLSVERTVRAAMKTAELSSSATVCVLLTGDAAVRDLNDRFRNRDVPTNVLSFPAPPSAHPHLGDIALAFGVCTTEARAQDKRLADHLSHLLVHGLLHLVGYDHESDAQAKVMEDMEREVLRGLGVADPYVQREADGEL